MYRFIPSLMTTVVVTRRCRITLPEDIRKKLEVKEGDHITINVVGRAAIMTKGDPTVWQRSGNFLPPAFDKTLAARRTDTTERLRKLGIA